MRNVARFAVVSFATNIASPIWRRQPNQLKSLAQLFVIGRKSHISIHPPAHRPHTDPELAGRGMDRSITADEHGTRRFVAVLLALADLTERTSARSEAVRRLALWHLRSGEIQARDHLAELREMWPDEAAAPIHRRQRHQGPMRLSDRRGPDCSVPCSGDRSQTARKFLGIAARSKVWPGSRVTFPACSNLRGQRLAAGERNCPRTALTYTRRCSEKSPAR